MRSFALRAFVAIELPEPALTALADAQGALRARAERAGVGRGIRWVSPGGVHLTLKFLGSVPADLAPEVERRLAEAVVGEPPFSLELAGLGAFPGYRAPRVLWVGLAGELGRLAAVQRGVEAAISPLGYPTEGRPFSPHLTLARVAEAVGPAARQELGEAVRAAAPPAPAPFAVAAVSLMRSELGPGGARYSRLASAPLQGRPG